MKNIAEAEGVNGKATLVPGPSNKAVIELRSDDTGERTNLVVTFEDQQIVNMLEYRNTAKARRIAGVE